MLKKIILIIMILNLIAVIFAQENNNVKYDQKSVRKAMLLSSLFPGAGQYYADKSSFTTYIFPIIEVGLWAGYIYYHNKGADTEEDYMDFADEHYNRDFQHQAENDIIFNLENNSNFYENHFRLDDTNTQHFYEDIGKYPKYAYGWLDWFEIYATDGNDNFVSPNWHWIEQENGAFLVEGLIGPNYENADYLANQSLYDGKDGLYSSYRQTYIDMRQEAEGYYDKGRNFSFGIIANHLLSALDAIRLSKKYNRQYAENDLKFNVAPTIINEQLSLALVISKRF
jgi:hypothetical protein